MMDVLSHILPKGYNPPDIDIPYLHCDTVNEGSYAEYPRVRGFQMHQGMDGLILQVADDRSYADYTRLLQSWLFFGFLREICIRFKKPFKLSKLVSFPINGRPKITASSLSPSMWSEDEPEEASPMSNTEESEVPLGRIGDLIDVLFLTQHHAALFDFSNLLEQQLWH